MSSSNTKMEELRLSHARGHWFKSSIAHLAPTNIIYVFNSHNSYSLITPVTTIHY